MMYKLIVGEPWDFDLNGNNVIHGTVIKQLSPTFLLFKSDSLLSFEGQEGHILILKPRYTKEFFDLVSDEEISVNAALFLENEYENKDEEYLMSHCQYVIIGSLMK